MKREQDFVKVKSAKAFEQPIRYRAPEEKGRWWMTDVDGMYDFKGKAFLMVEYKLKGTALPMGQRLLGENLIKSSRVPFVFAFVEHDDADNECIDGDFAIIRQLWYGKGDGQVHNGDKHIGKHVWELKEYMHATFEEGL